MRTAFGFTDGGRAEADGAVLQHTRLVRHGQTAHRLKAGDCAKLAVVVRYHAEIDTGPFTGQVVVTSADAGIARRNVTISGPPDVTVPAQSVTDMAEVKVVHKSGPFHFLVPDHGKDTTIALQAPPAGKRLDVPDTCGAGAAKPSRACPPLGALMHSRTSTQVVLAGHAPDAVGGVVRLPVRLLKADDVGEYTGTIHPSGDPADDHPIKTVVKVTDAWWWALIALLIGAALVMVPQLWMRRYKQKSLLRARANALLGGYSRAKIAFRGDGRIANFPDIDPPEGGDVAVYAEDVREAIGNLLRSMVFVDARSEAYRQVDTSLVTAEEDITCWGDPNGLLRALTTLDTQVDDTQDWLRRRRFTNQSPDVARRAATLLARRRLKIGEAQTVMAQADSAAVLLHEWRQLACRVLRLQLWWRRIALKRGEDTYARFDDLAALGRRIARYKRALREVPDAAALHALRDDGTLEELHAALEELGGPLGISQPREEAGAGSMEQLWRRFGFADEVRDELAMRRPEDEATVSTGDELIDRATAQAFRPATSVRLQRSWRWVADVFCIVLAILVALVTAMAAIVNDKNFGSAKDYLTVIFIGTAAQVAVSAVIPVINSALGDRFGTSVAVRAVPASATGTPVTEL